MGGEGAEGGEEGVEEDLVVGGAEVGREIHGAVACSGSGGAS